MVIEEADVLVHIEDVLVGQTFHIFGDIHNLLKVLVLSVAEDGVVYYDAIDFGVIVRVNDGVF
jgi:hypothetical protein